MSRPRLAILVTLATLALARAIFTFVPTMDAWGLDAQRFLPAWFGWTTWLAAAAALAVPLAPGLAAQVVRRGDGTATARGAIAWALVAMAVVLALPDRTWLTGDFILRRRAIEEGGSAAALFPQALPLDVLLHVTLPRALFERGMPADLGARAWGAIAAAAVALAAVTFARALRFRGAAAFAATGAIAASGCLALFTGYGKGLVDVVALVALVAALAARVVATGRGVAALALATAAGIALHRAGLLLLPALVAGVLLARRRHGSIGLAWLLLPVAAAWIVAPAVWTTFRAIDVPTHLGHTIPAARWNGIAQSILLAAPVAPLALVLPFAFGRMLPRRAEIVPALCLVAAFGGLALLVAPQQGHVRDWDVVAPAAMALAVVAAWLAGEALAEPAPARGRGVVGAGVAAPALAIVLAAAMPSLQWLVHFHDPRLGLARARAVIAGPPALPALERGRLWDYTGVRLAWLDDWAGAADAFAHAAADLPTPRVLGQWAKAEVKAGAWERARTASEAWTRRAPADPEAWRTLAATVTHLRDRAASRDAAEHILALDPTDPDARGILDYLDRTAPDAAGAPADRRP